MLKDQKGATHYLAILLVIVLAGAGFAGYKVYQANQKPPAVKTETKVEKTSSTPKLTWAESGIAVPGTFADADVVKLSDKQFRMYYGVQPEVPGNRLEVYSSTSTDGKTWTKENGARRSMTTFPDVVKLANGKFRMYFQQAGVIKSAISTDGLSFTDEAGTRIDKTTSENLNLDNVAAPTVSEMTDGTFVMVYRGSINTRYAQNTPNPSTQVLLWATSSDGLTFTKKGLAIDSRNDELNGQLDGPDLVKWDTGYKLFATSYTGVYEFSFDGKTFGKPALAFAGEAKKTDQGFNGAPPGDPSIVKVNESWFMYYGGPRNKNGINYAILK